MFSNYTKHRIICVNIHISSKSIGLLYHLINHTWTPSIGSVSHFIGWKVWMKSFMKLTTSIHGWKLIEYVTTGNAVIWRLRKSYSLCRVSATNSFIIISIEISHKSGTNNQHVKTIGRALSTHTHTNTFDESNFYERS